MHVRGYSLTFQTTILFYYHSPPNEYNLQKYKSIASILKLSPPSYFSYLLSGVQNVIQKRHTLEGKLLTVKPHYPFLENTKIEKTELTIDPEVFNYIQMNHERKLQMVLEECNFQKIPRPPS